MGGLQTMQNRLPTNVGLPGNSTIPPTSVLPSNNVLPVTNNIPGNSNLSTNPPLSGIGLPSNLKNDSIPQTLPALHNPLPQSNMPMSNLQNIPGGLSGNLQNSLPTKNSHTNVDTLNDNNPINNLLRQFANKSQTQVSNFSFHCSTICILKLSILVTRFVVATKSICTIANKLSMATTNSRCT